MSADPNPRFESTRLRVGDLQLDLGAHVVTRDGKPIKLPRLSYQLLLTLVRASPDMITNEGLAAEVWSGRVVSPETITQRIRLLRRALGDDANAPVYIGLVRGEGYRLLVDVAPADETPTVPRPRVLHTPAVAITAALVLVCAIVVVYLVGPGFVGSQDGRRQTPGANTLAVLPFVNANQHAEDVHIAEGISDELRDQLGRIRGLQVAAWSSSNVFRTNQPGVTEIARNLRVKWLIESTVDIQDERLVITVRIIDGETGYQTWSRVFDRDAADLLNIHQDIAADIVGEILPEAQAQLAASNVRSKDVSAHTLMLLARHLEQQVRDRPLVNNHTLRRAITLYKDAIATDPDSALAHSRLARALLYTGDVEGAGAPVLRAMELDPHLSDAHYALGLYHWRRGESEGGAAYARAVELNPNNPDALAAHAKWLWHNDIVDKPGELLHQALELDPLTLERYADLGNYYGIIGQREAGLDLARQIESIFPNVAGYRVLARVYEVIGDLDQAIAWATKAKQAHPMAPDIHWQLAELYARIGDSEQAMLEDPDMSVAQLFFGRRYEELIDLAEEAMLDNPNDIKLYYALAFAYNTQGYHAEAARLLKLVGLPDTVISDSRSADATEAMFTLLGAWMELGETDEVTRFARWLKDKIQIQIDTGADLAWWTNLYQACAMGLLGEKELMISRLEQVVRSPGLVWYPVLRDAMCFQPYVAEPRYQQVVASIEQRMAEQRTKLPLTLSRRGLDLAVAD